MQLEVAPKNSCRSHKFPLYVAVSGSGWLRMRTGHTHWSTIDVSYIQNIGINVAQTQPKGPPGVLERCFYGKLVARGTGCIKMGHQYVVNSAVLMHQVAVARLPRMRKRKIIYKKFA